MHRMQYGRTRKTRQTRHLQPTLLILALILTVGAIGGFTRQAKIIAHSQLQSPAPSSYLYYTLKETSGFVLARAIKGVDGQPVGTPQTLASFGDEFGLVSTDSVSTIRLSPDGRYVAIDGVREHGEQVWMYDTQHMMMSIVPANVMGNFLNWFPGGNGHNFLYRAMFPLGPNAPMDGNQWNPGLWIVDAASGVHTNIDIGVPSADIIDASASPDGSRIIYSITRGLGMGSQVWMMNRDGSAHTRLLRSRPEAQSIVGDFSWSPDGSRIAYERLLDSSTPFLPAGLWVMNSQGTHSRFLAQTDGGHGFTLSWSPDSRKIAYIVRTNSSNHQADVVSQSLECTIGIADIRSGQSWLAVTNQQTGMQMNVSPVWASDSASITFAALNPINRVIGGSPRYWSAHITQSHVSTQAKPLTPALAHVIAIS